MENEAYKIRSFLESVAECGAAQAIKQLEPASDKLTQRKAYEFFRKRDTQHGGEFIHGEAWVKRMVQEGKLHPVRERKSTNSPLYYSKTEMLQVLATEEAVRQDIFKGTLL